MARDYVLRDFKKEDYQDAHGNYWCTAAFEGVGEPVKWVVKNPMSIQEGQTYYGEIKELTSKAGKPYMRFYKQQRPDGAPVSGNATSERPSTYKDNSDGMRQGMCFNNATLFVNMMVADEKSKPSPEEWAELVFTHAQALYRTGDLSTKTEATEQALKAAGLTPEQETVYEVTDDPIDLNSIPF